MDDDHLHDIFAGVAPVTIRRMFGGKGIYSNGLVFALEAYDQVWIKADDETRPVFEAAGSNQFSYESKGRTVKLPYWRLPDAALEEPDEAARWARLGIATALRRSEAKIAAKTPRKAEKSRKSA